MKTAVCKRLLDEKPSVRKEAVDLLGSFVLSKPGLADPYYDELMARIMVTLCASFVCVSVCMCMYVCFLCEW